MLDWTGGWCFEWTCFLTPFEQHALNALPMCTLYLNMTVLSLQRERKRPLKWKVIILTKFSWRTAPKVVSWDVIRPHFTNKAPFYTNHDDVIKWKRFPLYWPFVRGIHRSSVISPHKGQWRWALMFSLICSWINGWVNNREAGDLRRHRAHYYVSVMIWFNFDSSMDK